MGREAEPKDIARRTLPAFSIGAVIGYFLVMGFGLSPFIYYPLTGEFHLTRHEGIGPPMFFYGWLVYAALIGLAAAGLAALLPQRISLLLAGRLSALSWLMPIGVTLCILYFLRNYFGL